MISFAITAHAESKKENFGWLHRCVDAVASVDLIEEIVIVNDASDDYAQLETQFGAIPKVRLAQNARNLGVFGNKMEAIRQCRNEWVQLCDSDDVMDAQHFHRLSELKPWKPNTLYANSWGRPRFCYQTLVGTHTGSSYLDRLGNRWLGCQINTGNHFLNRERFLDVLKPYIDSGIAAHYPEVFDYATHTEAYWRSVFDGADSAFYNTRWLLAGGTINVVAGLEYQHQYNATATGGYHSSPPEKCELPPIYLDEVRKLFRSELPPIKKGML